MLGACLTLLLGWGFKALPNEQWQILATLPRKKEPSGTWVGVNITYYGLLSASAGLAALWDPFVFIALQATWVVLLFYTGWRMVTGGLLSFHVYRDRI